MMNKKNEDIYSFQFLPKKKGIGFMFQRITRRDMDNTQRVNGIS
jgi:hypothetical protein